MSPKKPTGFRISKATAEDLKALAKSPPLKPIRCKTRRMARKPADPNTTPTPDDFVPPAHRRHH